jgi:hypothetical protein
MSIHEISNQLIPLDYVVMILVILAGIVYYMDSNRDDEDE